MRDRSFAKSAFLVVPIKEDSPAYAECRRLAEKLAAEQGDDDLLSDSLVPAVVVSLEDLSAMYEDGEAAVEAHLSAQDASICPFYLEADVAVRAKDLSLSESQGYLSGTGKWPLTDGVGAWVADVFNDGEEQ